MLAGAKPHCTWTLSRQTRCVGGFSGVGIGPTAQQTDPVAQPPRFLEIKRCCGRFHPRLKIGQFVHAASTQRGAGGIHHPCPLAVHRPFNNRASAAGIPGRTTNQSRSAGP